MTDSGSAFAEKTVSTESPAAPAATASDVIFSDLAASFGVGATQQHSPTSIFGPVEVSALFF
jgi:hypothetical protein